MNQRGDAAIKGAIAVALIALGIFLFVFIRRSAEKPAPVEAEHTVEVPVRFDSTPQGAELEVDGKPTGAKTPTELKFQVRTAHTARFALDGYAPATAEFIAVDGVKPVAPQLDALIEFSVTTEPAEATVKKGSDVLVEKTPGTFKLTAGKYPLRIEKEGFVPVAGDQQLAESNKQLSFTLVKAAYLDISSDRDGAKIFLDEKDTGAVTPVTAFAVSANEPHTVVLRLQDDYTLPRKLAKLKPGKTLKLKLKLTNEHLEEDAAENRQIQAQIKKLQAEKARLKKELPKYFAKNGVKYEAIEARLEEIEQELSTLGGGETEAE